MKRIILITIFVFLMGSYLFAQSPIPELEKAMQIKLLETSREEVREIFADYHLETSADSEYYDRFSTKNVVITVSYSSGICPEDTEESPEWNVAEWKATNIEIHPKNSLKIQDIGIDFSQYRKERMYSNLPKSYMYHNKGLGIAFQVDENEIEEIHFIPQKKDYPLFCDIKAAKKHALSKSWFIGSLKDRLVIIDINNRPNVINLVLSNTEIITNKYTKIAVLVSAKDPENDFMAYYYEVSGGKIIGSGKSVVWDLSGEKAGNYTITAGADDGCGKCGNTMTKTVRVKECADC